MKFAPKIFAIDAGGTMTDTFVIDDQGRFVVGKAQTTPEDESIGFLNSITNALSYWNLLPQDAFPGIISGVYSGTTMVNRLLERKGSRVGVIVTAGFEDYFMLERGIQTWLDYSYSDRIHVATHIHNPPIVPRKFVKGVRERVDFLGDEVIPLYEDEAEKAISELLNEGVEYIVVNLLFADKNPRHERQVAEMGKRLIKERNVRMLLASEYYPVRRDFPRLNTVTIDAYAAEKSREQLMKLRMKMKTLGANFDLRTMASHGGTIGIEATELARTLVSGPIGGVIGGKYVADRLGIKNLVCSDIGGTSFDVSLITSGQYAIKSNPDIARFLLAIPSVQVNSIGAGTGSYVRVDPTSRRIEFGPDSAGYRVGVCNPQFDVQTVTMTDCDLVLGYVNPDYFLGGKVKLYKDRALKAVNEQLAELIAIDSYDAAEGAVRLLEDSLRNHVNAMVVGKGYEPVDYALIGYGGGGPLHVAGFTEGVGFYDVLVPEWAPAFSAFGCACGDFEYRFDRALDANLPPESSREDKAIAANALNDAWGTLSDKAVAEFAKSKIDKAKINFKTYAKIQYSGQLNDLEILSQVARIADSKNLDALIESFEDSYGRIYARAARSPELGYTITGAFVIAYVDVPKPQLPEMTEGGSAPSPKSLKQPRQIYWNGKWKDAQIYEMELLQPGNIVNGPAVIEAPATTFVIPPEKMVILDRHRIFHLK